jgi:hypothetical protein
MLVTEIYNALKQAQLVSTLEEYSTQWLNKHKTTASYLMHKKRDLSINAKINCYKNIKMKIIEIENSNESLKLLNSRELIELKDLKKIICKSILKNFKIK